MTSLTPRRYSWVYYFCILLFCTLYFFLYINISEYYYRGKFQAHIRRKYNAWDRNACLIRNFDNSYHIYKIYYISSGELRYQYNFIIKLFQYNLMYYQHISYICKYEGLMKYSRYWNWKIFDLSNREINSYSVWG